MWIFCSTCFLTVLTIEQPVQEVTLKKHFHSKCSGCLFTTSKGFAVTLWSDSGECFSKFTTRGDEGLLYLWDNRGITDSTTLGVSPMTKSKKTKKKKKSSFSCKCDNNSYLSKDNWLQKVLWPYFTQCFVPLETESRVITFTNGLKNDIIGEWGTHNVRSISLSFSQQQFLQWPHSFLSWRRAEEREGSNMTTVPDEVYLHNVCWAMWQVFCGQLLLWPLSSFWN